MNAVAKEIEDALVLVAHSLVDDWMLDSRASFHITSQREIIQNYVVGDFGKTCTNIEEALDVVEVGMSTSHFQTRTTYGLCNKLDTFQIRRKT